MKVIFVVDSISDINKKVEAMNMEFGSDINFVVKSPLVPLFKSFGYQVNAAYYNNLSLVIHNLLLRSNADDVVVYYSSLNLNNALLKKFKQAIDKKDKIVNVQPKYNFFEQMHNGAYNLYVNSLFKIKDSMASPKLQFLPMNFVAELLTNHFANRLFELDPSVVKNVYIEEKQTNNNLKVAHTFNRANLISLIIALAITIALVVCMAFVPMHFVLILTFIALYLLDIMLCLILNYKQKFDNRFLK